MYIYIYIYIYASMMSAVSNYWILCVRECMSCAYAHATIQAISTQFLACAQQLEMFRGSAFFML